MLHQAMNNPKKWGWLLDDGNYENEWGTKKVIHVPAAAGWGPPAPPVFKDVPAIIGTSFVPESPSHISTWQMMGMTGRNPSKRVQKSTLFKPQRMSKQLKNMLYPDNPKFLSGKKTLNVPKSALYNSGFHSS